MRKHTWKTTPKGMASRKFSKMVPTDIDEVEAIEAMFGTTSRMVWHAVGSRTVAVAPGIKVRMMAGNDDAADQYAESFVADGRKEAVYVPTVTRGEVDAQGFDEGQLAFVAKKFVIVD